MPIIILLLAIAAVIFYRRRNKKTAVEVRPGAVQQTPPKAAKQVSEGAIYFHPQLAMSVERQCRHQFFLGGTGSGKSQIQLRQITQAIERGDRVLVLDAQGDLTQRLKGSIVAAWDSRSLIWDIASDCINTSNLEALARAIVPDSGHSSNPIWHQAAQALIVAWCKKLIAEKGGGWGWADLVRVATAEESELKEAVLKYHPVARRVVESADVTLSGVLFQTGGAVAPLAELARAWTSPQTVDERRRLSLRRWILEPDKLPPSQRVLIVQMSSEHDKLTGFVLNSIIRIVHSLVSSPALTTDQDNRIWLYLDEFVQAGKVPEIRKLIEIARKKFVRVVLTAQTVDALADTYGRDGAQAILSTVGTVVICQTSGETARWAEKLFGTRRVKQMRRSVSESENTGSGGGGSHSGSSSSESYAEHEEELPVIRASEFHDRLGPDKRAGVIRAAVFGFKQPYVLAWQYLAMPAVRPGNVPAMWTQSTGVEELLDPAPAQQEAPAPQQAPDAQQPEAQQQPQPAKQQQAQHPEPAQPAAEQPQPQPEQREREADIAAALAALDKPAPHPEQPQAEAPAAQQPAPQPQARAQAERDDDEAQIEAAEAAEAAADDTGLSFLDAEMPKTAVSEPDGGSKDGGEEAES